MTPQQFDKGLHGSATDADGPMVMGPLDVEMPPRVYRKWLQVRRKLETEAGRPLEDFECLRVLVERARDADRIC